MCKYEIKQEISGVKDELGGIIPELNEWLVKLGCVSGDCLQLCESRQTRLLMEADSRIKQVEKTIRGSFEGTLDPDSTVSGEEYYVDGNPQTTWMQYLIYNLRHTLDLTHNAEAALLPHAAKIAYEELNFDKDDQDLQKIRILKRMLDIIKKDQDALQSFKQNSSQSFDDLYQVYGKKLKATDDEIRQQVDNGNFQQNDDYDIIPIQSREEAYKYGQYSGVNGKGALCYTTDGSAWRRFINDGTSACYLCLRKDWKDAPCEKTSGYPKDSYGLSMIFLFVGPDGKLEHSNVRWNHGDHSFDDVDNMFNEAEISQIVGRNFYDVFKPKYTRREAVEKAMRRLAAGEKPQDVFDWCDDFHDGFARVEFNGKWNFIGTDGNLLFLNRWFDWCYTFSEGYGQVKRNGKWNWTDTDGQLLFPNQWFDDCGDFYNGYAAIKLMGQWNFIDTDGNLLSPDQWFDWCDDFHDGYAAVDLDGQSYDIDADGNLYDKNSKEFIRNMKTGDRPNANESLDRIVRESISRVLRRR